MWISKFADKKSANNEGRLYSKINFNTYFALNKRQNTWSKNNWIFLFTGLQLSSSVSPRNGARKAEKRGRIEPERENKLWPDFRFEKRKSEIEQYRRFAGYRRKVTNIAFQSLATRGQFYQCSTGNFCASWFAPILLAHSSEHTA